MVKLTFFLTDDLHSEESSAILIQAVRELVECIEYDTLPKFIILLSELSNRLKPCKKSEQAYSILISCIILQRNLSKSPEIPKNIQKILSNLIELQISQKPLHSKSSLFQSTQSILNNSANLLNSLKSLKSCSLKIFHLMHFLTIFSSLSFKSSLRTLLKLLTSTSDSSIFSSILNNSAPFLPDQELPKPTLVLDLDETLCHLNGSHLMSRPGAQDFVTRLSEKFELVIFTAAQENYANWALAIIDPLHKIVFRLYRQHLTCYGAGFVKDLSILGRDLDRVAIIDNEPGNFRCQPENGIKISTWTGQADDRELFRIQMAFLEIWHEGVGFKEFIKDLGF